MKTFKTQNSKRRKYGSNLYAVLKKIYAAEVSLEANHHCKKKMLIAFLNDFKEFAIERSIEFREMFRGFYCTGSYFEGLRVKMATEFDVNVQLSFGLDSVDYLVNELDGLPSYATYKLSSSPYQVFTHGKFRSFFDCKNYLIGQNVLKWFQSLVDSYVNNADLDYPGILMIKTAQSGPALTVKVLFNKEWISIDLVPVFSLSTDHLYKYTLPTMMQVKEAFSFCFLVPKPLHPKLTAMVEPKTVNRVWRINFAGAEKKILDSKQELKPAIQLLKALRDKEDWPLPSYFLKIIGLHVTVSNLENAEFSGRLDHLFLELLESLKMHLETGFLPHLFYRSFNIFHTLNSSTIRRIHHRVQIVIQMLCKRPDRAYQLFKMTNFLPVENIATKLKTDADCPKHLRNIFHSTDISKTRISYQMAKALEKHKMQLNRDGQRFKESPKPALKRNSIYFPLIHADDPRMNVETFIESSGKQVKKRKFCIIF